MSCWSTNRIAARPKHRRHTSRRSERYGKLLTRHFGGSKSDDDDDDDDDDGVVVEQELEIARREAAQELGEELDDADTPEVC